MNSLLTLDVNIGRYGIVANSIRCSANESAVAASRKSGFEVQYLALGYGLRFPPLVPDVLRIGSCYRLARHRFRHMIHHHIYNFFRYRHIFRWNCKKSLCLILFCIYFFFQQKHKVIETKVSCIHLHILYILYIYIYVFLAKFRFGWFAPFSQLICMRLLLSRKTLNALRKRVNFTPRTPQRCSRAFSIYVQCVYV